MKPLSTLRVLLVLLIGATPAFCGMRPSFFLDGNTWDATYIVVVQTTSEDGFFDVLESWKGNLPVHTQIHLPDLAASPNALPISTYPSEWGKIVGHGESANIPRQPIGSHMVLFLVGEPAAVPPNWHPADQAFHAFKTSALWIDGDETWCFVQLTNPGVTLFSPCGSETKIRSRLNEVLNTQQTLELALSSPDSKIRASRLQEFLLSDVGIARLDAIDGLKKCGSDGAAVARGLLDDPRFVGDSESLLAIIAFAGGPKVAPELHLRLQQELTFWQTKGPLLAKGWWIEDPTPRAPLRDHYGATLALVSHLGTYRYSAAIPTVKALRNLWRSLPQLNDPSGLNEMAEECDRVLSQLANHQ